MLKCCKDLWLTRVYSGSEYLDSTVPPPWERICTVPAKISASPGVFPCRKTKRQSSRPPHLAHRRRQETSVTSGHQHVSGLSASTVEKNPSPNTRAATRPTRRGARHSSERFVFRLLPLFLSWGNVFVRRQPVRLRCHWIIFTGQLERGRAGGKPALRKHHSRSRTFLSKLRRFLFSVNTEITLSMNI